VTLPLLLFLVQDSGPIAPEACADCHEAIVSAYRETGMARALEPIRPDEFAGLAPLSEPGTGLVYALEGSGERARIVESLATPGGAPHRLSAPLAFAVGAGVQDRSYAALRHGRLWFAPLEVVSGSENRSRRAALAPGHSMRSGLRFGVPITPECLSCHTDSLPRRDFPLNLDPRARGAWTPNGISCGACHAGAREHASWREASLAGREAPGADPIQDLSFLPRTRRLSICAACHLQGDVRIELGEVGLPPRGDDLLQHRAIFVAREATSEVGFVSQVERMVLSRCYLESAAFPGGGLTCETCHDPHRPLPDVRERERARAACTSCHAEVQGDAKPAGACSLDEDARRASGCADCHLPERNVFDVEGVTIHDHWIRKDPGPAPPRAKLRFPESPTGDWKRFQWPDAPPPAHDDDAGLWMMAFYQGGHQDRAREFLAKPASAAVQGIPMFHHVRGALFEGAGRLAEARAAYERALELAPELGESATNLGIVLGRLGEARRGIELLSGFLEAHPRADGVLRNRAVLRQSLGDAEGALADLERAMEFAPDAAVARVIASLYEQRGWADRAAFYRDEARRLDPIGGE